TPGQEKKEPFVIPLAVGLVDADGRDIVPKLESGRAFGKGNFTSSDTLVLAFTQPEESFVFSGVEEEPVPSLLRGFSAPVQVRYDYSDAELTHLLAFDSDPFNRWEAGQVMVTRVLMAGIESL